MQRTRRQTAEISVLFSQDKYSQYTTQIRPSAQAGYTTELDGNIKAQVYVQWDNQGNAGGGIILMGPIN